MAGVQKQEFFRPRREYGHNLALIDTSQTPDTILLDHFHTNAEIEFLDFFSVERAEKFFREDPALYRVQPSPQERTLIDASQTPDTALLDFVSTESMYIPWMPVEVLGEDPSAGKRRTAFFPIILRLLAEGYLQ